MIGLLSAPAFASEAQAETIAAQTLAAFSEAEVNTYSREQFLEMWQTRGDKADAELAGKFLAVLPATADIRSADDFFTNTPRRQSAPAVAQGAFRAMP